MKGRYIRAGPFSFTLIALTFPVWIPLGSLRIHPHFFFELLAYAVAGAVYWRRRRALGDHLSTEARWAIASAAVVGAVFGSRILFWFEDPQRTVGQLTNLQYLAGGQTIVGALIGGWIAVDLAGAGLSGLAFAAAAGLIVNGAIQIIAFRRWQTRMAAAARDES